MVPKAKVTLEDVESASRALQNVAVETPLLPCPALDERLGGRVLLKPECLQQTGSFKIRGAYNLMSRLSDAERRNGVVAWSSGNHAQGVAAAGSLLGIPAAIVMPGDAPRAKIDNTQKLGGETVLYDRYAGDREQIARELAAERGSSLVPSYDHPHIIAGQGTVGLEIVRQLAPEPPDQVLIPCSGGGLSAGCAVAIAALSPRTRIYAVEPAGFDDTARSLRAGERLLNRGDVRSICDALQVPMPGELTFDINRRLLHGGLVVDDDEVRDAMRFALTALSLVVEPGGAVALAAVLNGRLECRGRTTVIVLSGGNVDVESYARIQAGK